MFNSALATIPVGTVIPEVTTGVYHLDLWHPTGAGFNATFDRTAGGDSFPLTTGGPCKVCNINAIPTMGEWGLIILALLVLSFSTLFIMKKQAAMVGSVNISFYGITDIPFNKNAFGQILICVIVGITVVFALAINLFGYKMTGADVPGSLVAGTILAYLMHLITNREF